MYAALMSCRRAPRIVLTLLLVLACQGAWAAPGDDAPDESETVPSPAPALPHVSGRLAPEALLPAAGDAAPPFVAPAELFAPDVHMPTLVWPEARFQKRFGLWELDLRGQASATPGVAAWAEGLPASTLGLSLTWRYHGLLNGVVRPVVGVSASAAQAWMPPHWSQRGNPLWTLSLAPSAGVEVVYRGVGVGWRAAVPMGLYQTTPDGFYHPQLMGKRKADWGTFVQGMLQNMYLIWEPPAKGPQGP